MIHRFGVREVPVQISEGTPILKVSVSNEILGIKGLILGQISVVTNHP